MMQIRHPQRASRKSASLRQSGSPWLMPEQMPAWARQMRTNIGIGASHDPLEREAGWMSDQVLAKTYPTWQKHTRVNSPLVTRLSTRETDTVGVAEAGLQRNSGMLLDGELRHDMERRFGSDFSRVRVHTDGEAEQSASALHADAYTIGQDIVFGHGRYAPDSRTGRTLLAHELTHVLQQASSGVRVLQRQESADPLPPVPDVTLPRLSLFGPAEGEATLEGFATDRAELTATHRDQLRTLAPNLRNLIDQPPGGRVQVVGHTDRVGSEAHNTTLGQERADAVRDELIGLGVDAAAIRASSLGESVPAVETEAAEPRNRRVEVYFTPNSGPNFSGIFTGGLRPPQPLGSGPSVDIPGVTRPFQPSNACVTMPELCRPPGVSPDVYRPLPPIPERRLPSVTDVIWNPIDRALERGLRDLGLSDTWNRRLRDAARAGAGKAAAELLDQAMDAANLQGETREAVGTALRAAVQLEIPF